MALFQIIIFCGDKNLPITFLNILSKFLNKRLLGNAIEFPFDNPRFKVFIIARIDSCIHAVQRSILLWKNINCY